ncbi:molecular chaperone [Desulfuromonas versatilis]|uniref:Molecular chaperone n=1 Tax=Desulfuromonas versatilis TaxID=2802975 RepID=A0ABM8HZ07_9BACT|nr:Hsp20/alpha crystallin family protein [Desulfuromonas versatilis]BCR06336.1 molecular chaperone [Desulfuromonas versatilis]
MAIMKWDPLRELRAMQEQMSRLFDLSRDRAFGEPLDSALWQPPVDIYEDELEVVVTMELPEVRQEDIDVQIQDHTLIIQGERKLEREERKQNYHRIERSYGPFRRSFSLPATVDEDKTRASCEQGVLKVVLPKTSSAPRRQITVEVKGE